MNRSMSVFAQPAFFGLGTSGFAIGWNDQNARSDGSIGRSAAAATASAGAIVIFDAAGHGAPIRIHSASALI